MATSSKRFSYTIAYKLQVIQYAKEHGNRAAERHYGPPPTEKMENVPQVRCYRVTRLCIGKTTLAAHLHRRNLAPELYYPWCSQQLFTTLVPSSRRLSNCNAYENKTCIPPQLIGAYENKTWILHSS